MSRGSERSALFTYVARIGEFTRIDWLVYVSWVGMMLGLCVATGGFIALGLVHGVAWPAEAYCVPAGALVLSLAISIDTIGHRTIYKEVLRGGEQLVHHVTIACGIASCVLLTLAYTHRAVWIPAMICSVMSFVYSLVDEVFHWRRYITQRSDPVEMWSHAAIFIGHGTMMLGWWRCFQLGYPGVRETLAALT